MARTDVPLFERYVQPCSEDDAELRWFVDGLGPPTGTPALGYPLIDSVPSTFGLFCTVSHSGFEPMIAGRIPAALGTELWSVLVRETADPLRALFWQGWGVLRDIERRGDGAVVSDSFLTHYAYEASGRDLLACLQDPTTSPYGSPTYWWPVSHDWLVFTNVDAHESIVGFRSESRWSESMAQLTALRAATGDQRQ